MNCADYIILGIDIGLAIPSLLAVFAIAFCGSVEGPK